MAGKTVPFEAFPFCGPSYQALSPVVASDRTINLYPEKNMVNTGKAPVGLMGRPGLDLFMTLPNGPVRAIFAGNGRMFAVGGTHVYEFSPSAGTVITDFGAISGSSGTGPCQLVSNGNQLLVMDSSTGQISFVNPVGPAVTVVYNGFSLEYLDTYFYALASGTANKLEQSDSLDGTTWPGDFVQITGTPDYKRRIIQVNGLMWILGQQNTEVWYNAGSTPFALERMGNGTLNVGINGNSATLAGFSAVRINNTLLWLGADERGFGKFWRADGLTPVRISPPGIEALLNSYGVAALYDARSFPEEYNGHQFYVTNLPGANSNAGATLVYDLTTGYWHERSYNNGGTAERARPDCSASLQDATNATAIFQGDYANGNIYKVNLSGTSDNGTSIVYRRITPHVSNQNLWLKHQCLTMDAAIGSATPTVAVSDDGGLTYGSYADFQTTGTVATEGVKTWQKWQLGRSRDRVYDVKITTSADTIRIANAWLSVEGGIEQ